MKTSLDTNLKKTLRKQCGPHLIRALLLTLSHLGIYLTAAEMYKETEVFPKLNLLTNHSRLLLHMQIMLRVDKLVIPNTCRKKTMAFWAMSHQLRQDMRTRCALNLGL